MTTDRLLLLDSASLYFRAFYGVPDQRTVTERATDQRSARLPRHDRDARHGTPADPPRRLLGQRLAARSSGSTSSPATRRTGSPVRPRRRRLPPRVMPRTRPTPLRTTPPPRRCPTTSRPRCRSSRTHSRPSGSPGSAPTGSRPTTSSAPSSSGTGARWRSTSSPETVTCCSSSTTRTRAGALHRQGRRARTGPRHPGLPRGPVCRALRRRLCRHVDPARGHQRRAPRRQGHR